MSISPGAPPVLHPFVGRDAPWLIDSQARFRGDKVALVWEPFVGESMSWTYAAFAEETRRYAAGLAEAGVGAGDFVVAHLDNCPEFLFAWFACSRLGAVVVSTNTRSTGEEMAYFIGHCGAKAAITQPKYAELVEQAAAGRLAWIACLERDWGLDESAPRPTHLRPFESLRGDPAEAPKRLNDPFAPNSVQYTSGTTARPKGVVWTHANALWGARVTASHLRLTPEDATPVFLPLFHTNAFVFSTMATLWSGGTLVLMPRFSASRFWDVVVRHGCTWSCMTAFPRRALLSLPTPAGLRLKLLGSGAGDIAETEARWGARTIGWFGMTETITQCIISDLGLRGPQGSMGSPAPEYGVAIRRDDGSDCAHGESGELWIHGVRGLSLFLEYLNDPAATAAAFDADGWFDTGDLARSDGAGEIFYAGRAKDMLKVGGENVAALEIETVIRRTAGVSDVAVVGKPDPMRDEVPVAFVVADQPGPALEASIVAACQEALADFKRPREVIFIDDLPKGLLDKVLKRDLRARLVVASGPEAGAG